MGKQEQTWREHVKEAKQAYRAAKKRYWALTGTEYSQRERYQIADLQESVDCYLAAIADIERGAYCPEGDKIGIYWRAAFVLACTGDRERTLAFLEKSVQLRRRKSENHYLVEGLLHLLAEEYREAIISFNQALKIYGLDDIKSAYLRHYKARALAGLGRYREAFDIVGEAVKLAPKKVVFWELYTLCARELGDDSQAERGERRMGTLMKRFSSDATQAGR